MSGNTHAHTEVISEVVFLGKLVDRIREGSIRVPEFQRPFVWIQQDVHSLLESVLRGFPIGSILLWDTEETISSSTRVGPIQVASKSSGTVSYLLDGQQRLTALAGTLLLRDSHAVTDDNVDWRVFYDLDTRQFRRAPRGEKKSSHFPVASLLTTAEYLSACRGLSSDIGGPHDQWLDEADRVANAFRNYQVPIIRLQEANLESAVTVFARLNRKGRKISADQMVSALTYKKGEFHLAKKLDEFEVELNNQGFGSLNRVFLLRAVLAALDRDIYAKDWTDILVKEDIRPRLEKGVEKAETGVRLALKFLQEIGVTSDRLLPYGLQLVLLAEFFRQCPQPAPKTKKLLERWFWVTSFTGWFGAISTAKVTRALREIQQLAKEEGASISVVDLQARALPFPKRFDPRSARVRAFMIYLASLQPKWDSGTPLDPGKQLSALGTKALHFVVRSEELGDQELARSPANRMYVDRIEAGSLLSRLKEMEGDKLASHGFIPENATRQLSENDLAGLVRGRLQALIKGERRFLRERKINPPKQETAESVADSDTSEDETGIWG